MNALLSRKSIDNTIALLWRDAMGIVHGSIRPNKELTLPQMQKIVADIKSLAGDGKYCFILDASEGTPRPDSATFHLMKTDLPKLVKAVALIYPSMIKRQAANLYFTASPLPFPIKMFGAEEEAQEWLMPYVKSQKPELK